MKKILIIAGPNGAGKTTFAGEFLPNEAGCHEFVNADLIAAGLSPFRPDRAAMAAGRIMLARIDELAHAEQDFAIETTLATRSYLRMIPRWQASGYRVKLYFLTLPNPEFAIQRVERRIAHGGHAIPIETIRRRFARGAANLNDYLTCVDEWAIYDGSLNPPVLLETGQDSVRGRLMDDSVPFTTTDAVKLPVRPLDDPDFIGADAAIKRASAKAVARDIKAGLVPVVREGKRD